jgi:hypothetical protein
VVDHISHGREAVYAAEFAVDTAEPGAHRAGSRYAAKRNAGENIAAQPAPIVNA